MPWKSVSCTHVDIVSWHHRWKTHPQWHTGRPSIVVALTWSHMHHVWRRCHGWCHHRLMSQPWGNSIALWWHDWQVLLLNRRLSSLFIVLHWPMGNGLSRRRHGVHHVWVSGSYGMWRAHLFLSSPSLPISDGCHLSPFVPRITPWLLPRISRQRNSGRSSHCRFLRSWTIRSMRHGVGSPATCSRQPTKQ